MRAETADRRIRQRLLEAAVPLLAGRGLSGSLLRESADAAGCTLEHAHVFFGRDEELVLALYVRLAAELEARVPELPEGTLAERFRAAMLAKLSLVAPYKDALTALLATALDPRHELGALGEQTSIVRSRVTGVFSAVVLGASDRPSVSAPALARALYGAHLALVLLWTQDRSPDFAATRSAVDAFCNLLASVAPLLWLPGAESMLAGADKFLAPLLEPEPDPAQTATSERILRTLFRHRRLQPGAGACAESPCEQCLGLHLPKVRRFVVNGEPVHLLLPAFPAKSPNTSKVLGTLPDMAEELALGFLEGVCREIREFYPPGARVTICSDGRVFSDLVGVADADVTGYGRAMASMLARLDAASLDFLNLEDLFDLEDKAALREQLCAHYAEPLETIEERVRTYERHRALFNGVHRFLFEDRLVIEPGKSRNRLRQECRERALQVIRRSEAWGRLIQECFPVALRLSIHPQPPHSDKIGILLGEAKDAWLTPWHGVALKTGGGFRLVRRHEAEALGAKVVLRDGRPSHFETGAVV
ncbi:MAG TPA: L-tyrosine/L-tryptophan isonitrile synthase family protein [Pyrinomonadaceae bacterium]|jgi:pyoverdine/dityrosine biosynthesis protein Dit1/AcrR family transcriptional regulator